MTLPLVCVLPFTGFSKGSVVYKPADITAYLASRPFDFVQVNTPVFPLDLLSSSVSAGYALRRLSAFYSGAAIRVHRASDNAELDIGFTAAGDFDWASAIAFSGSSTGTVALWYDQSGNGNDVHAFGGDNAEAPALLISGSGAVTTGTLSRHSLLMNSTFNNWLTSGSGGAGLIGQAFGSVFAVANSASGVAGDATAGWWQLPTLVGCSSANPNGVALSMAFVQGGSLYSPPSFVPDRYSGSWLGGGVDRIAPVSYTFGTDQIFTFRWNTSDATPTKGYIGGGSPSTSANATANDAATNLTIGKGGNAFTAAFLGSFAEVILSVSELSIADTNILGANQAEYYGVPWATVSL